MQRIRNLLIALGLRQPDISYDGTEVVNNAVEQIKSATEELKRGHALLDEEVQRNDEYVESRRQSLRSLEQRIDEENRELLARKNESQRVVTSLLMFQ
jgi:hypothetical protein